MKIGVPKETADGERRVALVPEVIKRLSGDGGQQVIVERGAGAGALIPDEAFAEAGAELVDDPSQTLGADLVVKVAAPNEDEIAQLRSETVLIGFLGPLTNGEGIKAIAQTGATSFALEAVPRISRAQSMDALSSQANIGGYKAVLIAAHRDRALLPDADDRGGHDPPGDGAGARRRGRGSAGDRDRAPARRRGPGLRRTGGGQGAGRVAGSAFPRVRPRRRPRGRRRLREGADPRAAGPPAGADGRGDRQGRCRDHDRARPRSACPDPGDREGGRADEARAR